LVKLGTVDTGIDTLRGPEPIKVTITVLEPTDGQR
jgi:hypothetical protein